MHKCKWCAVHGIWLTLEAVHELARHQPCMYCTVMCGCLHLVWLDTLSGSVLNAGEESQTLTSKP
jgi:hypothetical protein